MLECVNLNGKVAVAARNIASLVPPGNTVVHLYPDAAAREEIWVALAMWVSSPPTSRVTLARLVSDLNEQFPALDATEPRLQASLRYVTRSMFVNSLPEAQFRALVEADHDIGLLMTRREKLKRLGELLDEAYLPGSSMKPKDVANLQRAWTQLADSITEMEQALGIVPTPVHKSEVKQETRRLDLKASLNRFGLGGLGEKPIDASFRQEPQPQPSPPPPEPEGGQGSAGASP
jgi:hypothetical protein